ncbi:MAG: thioredoxin domain-containing protein [Gammaproteobacteria bacterium]|nr:thioredoxin domain-containing protein [Gammaproteobacteria bacterium]
MSAPLSAAADDSPGGKNLPGAAPFSESLRSKIEVELAARDDAGSPRTKHLQANGRAIFTNRLILEASPYLQQHAHNPVNWYPWGDEAFAAAQQQGKPVLLSVGYSTCHWCHVMEDESFDNLEIATYLNRNYIAIKVDREQRPDIDSIYMAAVQALSGRGGWPMTVWLTADREPFFGGSYFPPYDGDRGVSEGFLTLLQSLRGVYEERRDDVGAASMQLMEAVRRRVVPPAGDLVPGEEVFSQAFDTLENSYDPFNGGLQMTQKFPSNLPIRYLLRYYRRSANSDALHMAEKTLRSMAAGGIYDQVGGGFHRYATDPDWLVPHFEKMIYDNALLAMAYLEAYQVSGDEDFARVSRDLLRYATRDMRASSGAFYTASDADSKTPSGDTQEGWFFTWSAQEIDSVLSKTEAAVVREFYGITDAGELEGRNVLHVTQSPAELAAKMELDEDAVKKAIASAREKLYRVRSGRPAPFRDKKILAAWNGLMISAFARAALDLGNDDYLATASRAARFILDNMQHEGRLLRMYTDGAASGNSYADDYAFFVQALLDLYEASGDIDWFVQAVRLEGVMADEFEDKVDGGFFLSSITSEALLAREKSGFDGSVPSANSIAILNLLRLYEFTSDDVYRRRAEKALTFFGLVLKRSPAALPEMLQALDFFHGEAREIVIVTANERADAEPYLRLLGKTFFPNHVLVVVQDGRELERHAEHIPLLEGKTALRGKTTVYVCEQGICELPTSDTATFAAQIGATGL